MVKARREEAFRGTSDSSSGGVGDQILLSLPFAAEDGAKMELEVRIKDTPATAAQRFCRDQVDCV
jgi:hypothetical protein